MKFKKLDDKTVCCMVSTEDLSDNNITIEDFIQNKDKVQDFLEEVVEAAKEEVGFETSGPMLSIQIMAMYPEGVMITMSEEPKDMAGVIKAGLAQLKGELGMDDEDWIEVKPDVIPEPEEGVEAAEKATRTKKENDTIISIFSFSKLEDVFAFAEHTSVRSGLNSTLYKDEKKGVYYLYLEKVRMSEERYRQLVVTAMEYGELTGATYLFMAGIEAAAAAPPDPAPRSPRRWRAWRPGRPPQSRKW